MEQATGTGERYRSGRPRLRPNATLSTGGRRAQEAREAVQGHVDEEARAVQSLLHVVRPNVAAPKRVSGVGANDVYRKRLHKGGLVTHTPLRNHDDEMAMNALCRPLGTGLDEFVRTGKRPSGGKRPRVSKASARKERKRDRKPTEPPRSTKKQKRANVQSQQEATSRSSCKQRPAKREEASQKSAHARKKKQRRV